MINPKPTARNGFSLRIIGSEATGATEASGGKHDSGALLQSAGADGNRTDCGRWTLVSIEESRWTVGLKVYSPARACFEEEHPASPAKPIWQETMAAHQFSKLPGFAAGTGNLHVIIDTPKGAGTSSRGMESGSCSN
ncbi:MAG: hypothetical protein H0W04_06390 [Chthoniobacterales bacterium]|nr:hypothetical protein [Chthoniobacterales bacterium]